MTAAELFLYLGAEQVFPAEKEEKNADIRKHKEHTVL